MTGVIARACLVAGCAATLLAATGPGAARGADTVPGGSPEPVPRAAPAWTYDPDEPIEPGDLAARMRDEQVPAEVAAHRFRVERAASGLQQQAAGRWPETFGGVWIDPRSSVVNVAFTSAAAANVAVLAAGFPFPAELRPVTVTYARADLLALQRRLAADAGVLTPAYGRYDLDVDLPANQAVIRLASVTPETRERLRTAYGPALRAETGLGGPHTCSPGECKPTMYGGLHVQHGHVGCTSAFAAFLGSYRYVLSAGHCFEQSQVADVGHQDTYYGSKTAHQQSGRVDAERIRRLAPGWRDSSKFFLYDGDPRAVSTYKRHATIVVGAYVGKTGRTTFTTRGYVKSTAYAPWWVPGASSFVTADYCAAQGDSGGPVFSGTTAFGIHSGGAGSTCRASTGAVVSGAYGVFGSIEYALSAMGVSLLTGVNAPPQAGFTWSCDTLMACEFNGAHSGDDDGTLASYLWDFGDGTSSTAEIPSHKYALPGTYTVRLTVRDSDGATASRTHAVTADALGGGPE